MKLRDLINEANIKRIQLETDLEHVVSTFGVTQLLHEFVALAENAGIVEFDHERPATEHQLLLMIVKELKNLSNTVAVSQAQLDADLAALQTAVAALQQTDDQQNDIIATQNTLITNLLAAFSNIQEKNANGGNTLDLSNEATLIANIQTQINNVNQQLQTVNTNISTSNSSISSAVAQVSTTVSSSSASTTSTTPDGSAPVASTTATSSSSSDTSTTGDTGSSSSTSAS